MSGLKVIFVTRVGEAIPQHPGEWLPTPGTAGTVIRLPELDECGEGTRVLWKGDPHERLRPIDLWSADIRVVGEFPIDDAIREIIAEFQERLRQPTACGE